MTTFFHGQDQVDPAVSLKPDDYFPGQESIPLQIMDCSAAQVSFQLSAQETHDWYS
jgi:hypothetical protein